MLSIRHTQEKDLNRINDIFNIARQFMKSSGNKNQWAGSYPNLDVVRGDMDINSSYVVCDDDKVVAYFALIIGEEISYNIIENGQWLNDEPYGTIHRVASDGSVHGIFDLILNFSLSKIDNIKVDTHEDNAPMRHQLIKNGFKYCGIIYVKEDHTARMAYQLCKKS